jgi:hypothetical protein
MPWKLFHKIEREGKILNYFYKAHITLMQKLYTHMKENYKQIYLINKDAKNLSKLLINQIQQHIQKTIPGMQ